MATKQESASAQQAVLSQAQKNLAVFNRLSSINVSQWTEKKQVGGRGLTYLTWAKAVELFRRECPAAEMVVEENPETRMPYFASEAGIIVYTHITVDGWTQRMWLPVMGNRNEALTLADPGRKATMNDINKTIQRCMVKNIAMFGLGLHVYAGEDLPLQEQEHALAARQAEQAAQRQANVQTLLGYISATDGLHLQGLWDANQAFAGDTAVVDAFRGRLAACVKACDTYEAIGEIYKANKWAHTWADFVNICAARRDDIKQETAAA